MSNYQYSEALNALIEAYNKKQKYSPKVVDIDKLFKEIAKPIHEEIFLEQNPKGNLGQSWNNVKGGLLERFAHDIIKSLIQNCEAINITFGNRPDKGSNGTSRNDEQRKARESIKIGLDTERKWSPDADLILYSSKNNGEDIRVEAIISCKTSLRERIAQTAFWKHKLASSDTTEHIKNILITLDSDKVFFGGKNTKPRAIALSELDAIFVLKPCFDKHDKLKSFDQFTKELKKWLKR